VTISVVCHATRDLVALDRIDEVDGLCADRVGCEDSGEEVGESHDDKMEFLRREINRSKQLEFGVHNREGHKSIYSTREHCEYLHRQSFSIVALSHRV
jgi:hypothetical protein